MKICFRYLLLITTFVLIVFTFASFDQSATAQTNLDPYESNLGVPTDQRSQSNDYILDSIMDYVGGESTSSSGLSIMHGYHFIDDSGELIITGLRAVPEKRVPTQGNNATYFLLEVYPIGADINSTSPLWTNASYPAAQRLTDSQGVWAGSYRVNLSPGQYDIYFTGLSFLKRRLANVQLQLSNNNLLFTDPEATANDLPNTRPLYALYSGDAAISLDPDGSCGSSVVDCQVYSGDEWGDNYVNGLDMSALVRKLFISLNSAIVKEDLNGDGVVNGLDISIAHANLFKYGDQ